MKPANLKQALTKLGMKWATNEISKRVQKFAEKVKRANPGIRANDDSGQKCRKPQKCRARLVISGFEGWCEIDQKVKGTPFEPFQL